MSRFSDDIDDPEAETGPLYQPSDYRPLIARPSLVAPPKGFTGEAADLSSALQVAALFPFQSWFDSVLLQDAIAVQAPNSPIVQPQPPQQYTGAGLCLHPSSQCPVAVTVTGDGTSSAFYILVPGQTVTPLGKQRFRSFRWGLPNGWLGGGVAQLIVSQQPYDPEAISARPEIPYHRQRIAIVQPSALASAGTNNAIPNWPVQFPWVNAVNQNAIAQAGQPTIAPEPTRVVLILRGLASLAANAIMRVIMQATNEFGRDVGGVAGALSLTNPIYEDLVWPAFNSIGTNGNLATQNPSLSLDQSHPLTRLAADSVNTLNPGGGVVFVDNGGAAALNGAYVDVVRFGRL